MFESRPNLFIGYHGCSKKHAEEFLARQTTKDLHLSEEDYEWLGKGFYIWENNYTRALEWRSKEYKTVEDSCVVGVIYSLEECLDLTDSRYLPLLSTAYNTLFATYKTAGEIDKLPKNEPFKDGDSILGKRLLDCKVIETLHSSMDNSDINKKFEPWFSEQEGRVIKPFDTVRSAFFEGNPVYEGATFQEKNHIQICIRNPKCIKGFFRPLDME